jgi:MFS family permease
LLFGMKTLLRPARRYALPCFLFLGYMTTLWLILFYAPIYLTDRGFSHLEIGILISFFPLTSLLLMFPFGIFADRLSPKKLVIAGLVISAIFLLGLRAASSFWGFLLFFFIGGIGSALFQISLSALYYKFLGETNKGIKLGFFSGFTLLGYGLGPLVGGSLLMRLDMDSLLLVALFVLLVPLSLSLFLEDAKPTKVHFGQYRKDILRKEVIILAALVLLLATHLGAEQTSLSLFLKYNVGLPNNLIGLMFGIIGVTISTLAIVNGFVTHRVAGRGRGLAPLLYLGMFFSGLCNIFMLIPRAFASVLTLRLFHVVGDSTFMVSQRVTVSNLFLAERIGGSFGLLEAMHTTGIFAGMIISGALPGYVLPFVVTGSLAVVAILPAIALRPRF